MPHRARSAAYTVANRDSDLLHRYRRDRSARTRVRVPHALCSPREGIVRRHSFARFGFVGNCKRVVSLEPLVDIQWRQLLQDSIWIVYDVLAEVGLVGLGK